MANENTARRRRPAVSGSRGGNVFLKFLLGLVLLLAVVGGILSFADIGGDLILRIAQRTLREQLGLELTAAGVSGNPIRGYTLSDFSIAAAGGERILSARSLSGSVNFMALLRGSVRLAELTVGGVDMDLDQFIEEVQRIKLPEGEAGGSEIPIDRIGLADSRFTSRWGTVEVAEVGADIKAQGGDQNLDIDVDGRVNGIPVKGGLNLNVGNGGIVVNRSDVGFGKGKVHAEGGIRPVSPTDSTNTLDLRGSVQGLDLRELTALWPSALKPEDYDGTAGLTLEATGTSETLKLVGALDYQGTRVAGCPAERASANVSYSGGRVTVKDIQASVLGVPIAGEIAVATHPGQVPSVMVKLEGREASLDGLDRTFPELKGLGGRVSSFSANVQGPANALTGTVNLAAPSVSYQKYTVTNIAAQLKLAKGNGQSPAATLNGKFGFEGAQGYLQGTIASVLTSPTLDLTANLVDLDLKRAAALVPDAAQYGLAGKITASLALKGSASNPAVSGTVGSGANISGFGQTLSKPSVTFSFANGTLKLQKSSGTLNAMPISVSGTVGPLPSSTPNVDISATVTVSPAALKTYVPDIESYALKGNINAGVKVQGKLPSPSVNLLASSPSLQALNLLTAKDIEVTTALGGDLTKLDKVTVNGRAASLSASGVTFSDLAASVNKNGDQITLSKLSARSGTGTVTGSGGARLSGKDAALDLSFVLDKLALGPLAAASGLDLKGTLTGALKVSGAASNPNVSFTANAPSVTAQGLTLTGLAADISGTMQGLKLNALKAEVSGAPLTATGSVQLSPSLKANVAIRGSALDLAALTRDYPGLKGQLAGKADLAFDIASAAKGGLSGKGAVTSSAVKAFGLDLQDVNLPLSWSGSTFSSSGGTAKAYSGTVKNSLTYNIAKSSFTDQLDASGVDVNALVQAMTGGLGGKITGQGKLSLKLNGSAAGKGVSYSGSGQFSMGSGAITGFTWLDLVTRLHGVKGIQYKNVTAPFTLQTGKLILKSGAIANSPDTDPIYIYAKLPQDGTIDFSGKEPTLNIVAEGKVNYQLINALAGGGKGGLSGLGSVLAGGASGLEEGLKQVLGGGLKGAQEGGATGDYREMSVKISGRASSPSFSNLKIGESTLQSAGSKAATETQQTQQGVAQKAQQVKQDAAQKAQQAKQNAKEAVKQAGDKAVEKVVDALLPGSKKQSQPSSSNVQQQAEQGQQPQQNQERSREEQAKEKLKEELGNQLKKGLGGLFKR